MDETPVLPSQCLYNIADLYKDKLLTQDEKVKLKYLVFLEHKDIFKIFRTTENEDVLVKNLKNLAKSTTHIEIEQLKVRLAS